MTSPAIAASGKEPVQVQAGYVIVAGCRYLRASRTPQAAFEVIPSWLEMPTPHFPFSPASFSYRVRSLSIWVLADKVAKRGSDSATRLGKAMILEEAYIW